MRTLFVLIAWLSSGIVYGQSYGVTKVYSDVWQNSGQDIEWSEQLQRTAIMSVKTCAGRGCSELTIFNEKDELVEQTTINNIDIASNTLERRSDSLLIFGNRTPNKSRWAYQTMTLEPLDSIGYNTLASRDSLLGVWMETSNLVGNKYMLIGDTKTNSEVIGMLSVLNQSLAVDTILYIDTVPQGRFTDVYPVTDTTFAVLYDEEGDGSINDRRRWLAVYDHRTYERLWDYKTEENTDPAISRGLYLGDGDFLFDVGVELRGSKFVRMNRDTVIQWQRDFSQSGFNVRKSLFTRDVIQTQDGHIVIAGACTDTYDLEYRPENTACITKMNSQTGEVMWQRYIYQEDPLVPGDGIRGLLTAVQEKPNGDLIMTGNLRERDQMAMLYVRTDSDGCITPDCGKYIDLDELAVSSEEVEVSASSKINVYPNPATDRLTISSADVIEQVTLHHLDGRIVYQQVSLSDHEYVVDVSNLSTGLYVVVVIDQQGRVSTSKVLVR